MDRRSWLRGWTMLWAVLQFALPTAALYADARVERESRSQAAHVESTSAATCRPVHPADCALCQALTNAAPPPDPTAPPVIEPRLRCPVSTRPADALADAAGRRPPARAPPTA